MKRKDKTQIHAMNIAELTSQLSTIGEQIKKNEYGTFYKTGKECS